MSIPARIQELRYHKSVVEQVIAFVKELQLKRTGLIRDEGLLERQIPHWGNLVGLVGHAALLRYPRYCAFLTSLERMPQWIPAFVQAVENAETTYVEEDDLWWIDVIRSAFHLEVEYRAQRQRSKRGHFISQRSPDDELSSSGYFRSFQPPSRRRSFHPNGGKCGRHHSPPLPPPFSLAYKC